MVLIPTVIVALTFVALAFTAIVGKRAERTAAALYLLNVALTWTAQGLTEHPPFFAYMLIDFAMATAFAALALRYQEKLWPGVAGCAQFFVFIFSVTHVIDFPLSEDAHIVAVNLSCLIVIGAMTAGAWQARWGKPRIDPWEEYATTLSALPPLPSMPPRSTLTLT